MIIVRLQGGMGNQMFQYATGKALALKHRVPLKLDTTFLINQTAIPLVRTNFTPRPYALDAFAIDATIASRSDIPWYARPFFSGVVMQMIDALFRKIPILPGWEKKFTFDKQVLSYGSDAYLAGFWQSEKYFAPIKEILQKEFSLKASLSTENQRLLHEIQSGISVCLHVRKGDFNASSFHGVTPLEFYTTAVEHITLIAPTATLFIFSNDIQWCKEHLDFSTPTTFVESSPGKYDTEHFSLMSACTHFIISNSTFSWWAAWLGKSTHKIVIVPKKWFGTARIDDRDIIPQNWIRI